MVLFDDPQFQPGAAAALDPSWDDDLFSAWGDSFLEDQAGFVEAREPHHVV